MHFAYYSNTGKALHQSAKIVCAHPPICYHLYRPSLLCYHLYHPSSRCVTISTPLPPPILMRKLKKLHEDIHIAASKNISLINLSKPHNTSKPPFLCENKFRQSCAKIFGKCTFSRVSQLYVN